MKQGIHGSDNTSPLHSKASPGKSDTLPGGDPTHLPITSVVGTGSGTGLARGLVAGKWLKYWTEAGAVVSSIGLYSSSMSSAAYLLAGMADLGHLPSLFAARAPAFGTPWASITVTGAVALGMSFASFDSVVAVTNFLYSLGMLLDFAAFVWLRARRPDLPRPYRVPVVGTAGVAAMCAVPSAFLVLVMAAAGWKVCVASAAVTAAGVVVYYVMAFCKARGCFKFGRAEGGECQGC